MVVSLALAAVVGKLNTQRGTSPMSATNAAKLSPKCKAYIATASPVLLLCTHDAGRSQMAFGFFEALTGDHAVAWSGGSEPGHEVNPAATAATAERGIDISNEFPKPWTDETVRAADVVIAMGCGDACPIFPGKRYESWDDLDGPAGLDTPAVRRVRHLIDRLALTPAAAQRLGRR